MYVIFGTGKKRIGKFLPNKKRYSLVEADEQLKAFAQTVQLRKNPNYVIIEIYDSEDMIFRSEFEAGTDESSNLRVLLLYLLKTEFPEADEEEKSELLQRINQAYLDETNVSNEYEELKVTEDLAPRVTIIEKESPIERSSVEKVTNVETERAKLPLKEEKGQVNTEEDEVRSLKKPAVRNAGFFVRKKKWLFFVVAFLLISGTGMTFFVTGSIGSNQKESYSELVKAEKYRQVLQDYPEEESQLVERLYSRKNSKELKRLAESCHSKIALFYWSFLNKKWKQVIEIEGISQDTTIQAMRGYAYLAQGKLEEAELINKVLKNDTLSDRINQAKKIEAYEKLRYQDISAAETINKEIQDSELEEDIQVAKSIMNLLKKYKADKSNRKLSEAERKEAQNNFDLWTSNLEQLGGKMNDGK